MGCRALQSTSTCPETIVSIPSLSNGQGRACSHYRGKAVVVKGLVTELSNASSLRDYGGNVSLPLRQDAGDCRVDLDILRVNLVPAFDSLRQGGF